jgi:hypothetical protein
MNKAGLIEAYLMLAKSSLNGGGTFLDDKEEMLQESKPSKRKPISLQTQEQRDWNAVVEAKRVAKETLKNYENTRTC